MVFRGRLTATTATLCFTLVPAALSFFLAQSQEADFLRLLGPSLAGVAGAALILPFELPSSTTGLLLLAAMAASAVLTSLAVHRFRALTRDLFFRQTVFHATFSSLLVAIALSIGLRQPLPVHLEILALLGAFLHILFSAINLALSIYLLRLMSPTAFATRFLVVPLLTIFEGYLILRPENTWTLGLGVLLIAAAVTMLLRESISTQNTLANPHSTALN